MAGRVVPVETGLCGPDEVVGARLPLLLRQPARLLRRQVPPAGEWGFLAYLTGTVLLGIFN